MNRTARIILALCLLVLWSSSFACASDLDDGISKPYDESIERDEELGQKDRNISFIKRNAMSQADVAAKTATRGMASVRGGVNAPASAPATGNLNSVVLGVGGSVRGDIVIIDQSRGDKTQVIGR